MGGRLLPADSGPAAMFMYENGKGTRLSCYFLSVDVGRQTEFKYREQKGISAFYWVEDGLAYAVTANAPRDQLLKVAEIIYHQSSPDSAKPKSLADLRQDTEALSTEHAATPAKWYFSPKDFTLLGAEVSVVKDDDPCELYFSDYKKVEAGTLPHRIEVNYGNGRFGVLPVGARVL